MPDSKNGVTVSRDNLALFIKVVFLAAVAFVAFKIGDLKMNLVENKAAENAASQSDHKELAGHPVMMERYDTLLLRVNGLDADVKKTKELVIEINATVKEIEKKINLLSRNTY